MAQSESELVDGLVAGVDGEQQVFHWRIDQLCELGFDVDTAVTLAHDVDLNEARKLIARGCPVEIAARILR